MTNDQQIYAEYTEKLEENKNTAQENESNVLYQKQKYISPLKAKEFFHQKLDEDIKTEIMPEKQKKYLQNCQNKPKQKEPKAMDSLITLRKKWKKLNKPQTGYQKRYDDNQRNNEMKTNREKAMELKEKLRNRDDSYDVTFKSHYKEEYIDPRKKKDIIEKEEQASKKLHSIVEKENMKNLWYWTEYFAQFSGKKKYPVKTTNNLKLTDNYKTLGRNVKAIEMIQQNEVPSLEKSNVLFTTQYQDEFINPKDRKDKIEMEKAKYRKWQKNIRNTITEYRTTYQCPKHPAQKLHSNKQKKIMQDSNHCTEYFAQYSNKKDLAKKNKSNNDILEITAGCEKIEKTISENVIIHTSEISLNKNGAFISQYQKEFVDPKTRKNTKDMENKKLSKWQNTHYDVTEYQAAYQCPKHFEKKLLHNVRKYITQNPKSYNKYFTHIANKKYIAKKSKDNILNFTTGRPKFTRNQMNMKTICGNSIATFTTGSPKLTRNQMNMKTICGNSIETSKNQIRNMEKHDMVKTQRKQRRKWKQRSSNATECQCLKHPLSKLSLKVREYIIKNPKYCNKYFAQFASEKQDYPKHAKINDILKMSKDYKNILRTVILPDESGIYYVPFISQYQEEYNDPKEKKIQEIERKKRKNWTPNKRSVFTEYQKEYQYPKKYENKLLFNARKYITRNPKTSKQMKINDVLKMTKDYKKFRKNFMNMKTTEIDEIPDKNGIYNIPLRSQYQKEYTNPADKINMVKAEKERSRKWQQNTSKRFTEHHIASKYPKQIPQQLHPTETENILQQSNYITNEMNPIKKTINNCIVKWNAYCQTDGVKDKPVIKKRGHCFQWLQNGKGSGEGNYNRKYNEENI